MWNKKVLCSLHISSLFWEFFIFTDGFFRFSDLICFKLQKRDVSHHQCQARIKNTHFRCRSLFACLCSISKIFQLEIKLSKLHVFARWKTHKNRWWKKYFEYHTLISYFMMRILASSCVGTKQSDYDEKHTSIWKTIEKTRTYPEEPGRQQKKKRNAMNSLIHKHENEWTRAAAGNVAANDDDKRVIRWKGKRR